MKSVKFRRKKEDLLGSVWLEMKVLDSQVADAIFASAILAITLLPEAIILAIIVWPPRSQKSIFLLRALAAITVAFWWLLIYAIGYNMRPHDEMLLFSIYVYLIGSPLVVFITIRTLVLSRLLRGVPKYRSALYGAVAGAILLIAMGSLFYSGLAAGGNLN